METKHTKGPWTIKSVSESDIAYRIIAECDEENVFCVWRTTDEIQTEANAKLIAAAPELLEALQEVRLVFNPLIRSSKSDKDAAWLKVVNAIKKATE